LDERDDGVQVQFGRSAGRQFHLVIGADGLHSNVRKLVFGPQDRFERDLSYRVSRIRGARLSSARPRGLRCLLRATRLHEYGLLRASFRPTDASLRPSRRNSAPTGAVIAFADSRRSPRSRPQRALRRTFGSGPIKGVRGLQRLLTPSMALQRVGELLVARRRGTDASSFSPFCSSTQWKIRTNGSRAAAQERRADSAT
jgi:2-polyprenyl-6-methoxyphenol hydroxylase-like FAD-dependent oxidoreductase